MLMSCHPKCAFIFTMSTMSFKLKDQMKILKIARFVRSCFLLANHLLYFQVKLLSQKNSTELF